MNALALFFLVLLIGGGMKLTGMPVPVLDDPSADR
jgi:hypothetical protein